MIALFPTAHEKMLLLSLDKKVTEQLTAFAPVPITHLRVEAFPSKPDDQRVVLQLCTNIGDVDPANPTIILAMSAAGAQKVIDNLNLAIAEANRGR
jgi:hypothetical protein